MALWQSHHSCSGCVSYKGNALNIIFWSFPFLLALGLACSQFLFHCIHLIFVVKSSVAQDVLQIVFVDADCSHIERSMSSLVCSPDGMYVVDASKDVVDGGAGCWISWVFTRGLADSVGPQIAVIRVSNHSTISSCCYAVHGCHEMIYDWL